MRVLVVDDSRAARAILKAALRACGHDEVIEAENGLEGLVRLKRSDTIPDMVLVDWNMPEMDGLEFVKRVRSDHAFDGALLMMVTSETNPERMVQALEAGANEYLMKPFEREGLIEKLRILSAVAD